MATPLPEEARTRTYSATVTLRKSDVDLPPERQTNFDVALSGASFSVDNDVSPAWPRLGLMNVTGDYVASDLDPWELGFGAIRERLAPATFVQLTGSVAGSIVTSGVSSLPFDGVFTYCVKSSDVLVRIPDPAVQGFVGCSSIDPVYKSCSSKNHRVVLTRR